MAETPFSSRRIETITVPSNAREYHTAMGNALLALRSYSGTKESYRRLSKKLATLNQCMRSLGEVSGATDQDQEQEVLRRYALQTKEPRAIRSILELAAVQDAKREAILTILKDCHENGSIESSPLLVRRINGAILSSPGENASLVPDHPLLFEDALCDLTHVLERRGVFLNDLIVHVGNTSSSRADSMRYALVEIPRLNRTVFLSDRNDISIIIHGVGDPAPFAAMDKNELIKAYGNYVVCLNGQDREQRQRMVQLLFTEDAWNMPTPTYLTTLVKGFFSDTTPTIDIKKYLTVREEVLKKLPDPSNWLGMPQREIAELQIPIGSKTMGRVVLARTVGIDGDPHASKLVSYLTAARLYGPHPLLQKAIDREIQKAEGRGEVTLANVKLALRESSLATIEDWLAISLEEVKKFKITIANNELSMQRIGSLFDISGKGVTRLFVLKIALKHFGYDSRIIKAMADEETRNEVFTTLTPDEVRQAVRVSSRSSIESWLAIRIEEARLFKVVVRGVEIGFTRIATAMGMGYPVTKLDILLLVGKLLGSTPELDHAIDCERQHQDQVAEAMRQATPERIRQELLNGSYGTAQSWLDLNNNQKITGFRIVINGIEIGLGIMAKKLGISGRPWGDMITVLNIAHKVLVDHPEDRAIIEAEIARREARRALTFNKVKKAVIQSQFNTSDTWINMKWDDINYARIVIDGYDYGIPTLCRVAGIEWDLTKIKLCVAQCAKKIFGSTPEINAAIQKLNVS